MALPISMLADTLFVSTITSFPSPRHIPTLGITLILYDVLLISPLIVYWVSLVMSDIIISPVEDDNGYNISHTTNWWTDHDPWYSDEGVTSIFHCDSDEWWWIWNMYATQMYLARLRTLNLMHLISNSNILHQNN